MRMENIDTIEYLTNLCINYLQSENRLMRYPGAKITHDIFLNILIK
jgi:hypothetical protein